MSSKHSKGFHYGWTVLAMGTLGVFGALGLARFGYTMVLPTMQEALKLNNEQAGLLATYNLAGYLALSIIGGALASRFGARLVASLGLAVAAVSMILTGCAENLFVLALLRGLTGIGSGAAYISIMGLWASWFTRNKRGMASGIAVTGPSVALITTGIFVPLVIKSYGENAWRSCWLIFGGITLLLAFGAFIIIRNRPAEVGLTPIGSSQSTQNSIPPSQSKALDWKKVYLSRKVWQLGLVYITYGFSYIMFMTFFVKHLVSSGLHDQASAGKLFMMMGWFSLLCGLLWGMISDKIGRKNTLVLLYILHSVVYGLFAIQSNTTFIICTILYGLTSGSIPAIMAALCGDTVDAKLTPAALGFITLFFGIGQVLGPVVAGSIADRYGSFTPAFILASTIAFLGAIGSLFIKKEASAGEVIQESMKSAQAS